MPGVRPVTFALTVCGVKLEPTSEGLHGTLVAVSYWLIWKAASVTYWNVQVVSRPNGLTVAFSVALVSVTFVADSLATIGGPDGLERLVGAVHRPIRVRRDRAEVIGRARRQPAHVRARLHEGEARAQVGRHARHARRRGVAGRLEGGVVDVLELAGRIEAERDDGRVQRRAGVGSRCVADSLWTSGGPGVVGGP